MPDRPHANTYWAAPGLLAGEYPGDRDPAVARRKLDRLVGAGVTLFIDLTEDGELAPYAALLPATDDEGRPVRYERHPIRDVNVPQAPAAMAAVLDRIDAARAAGETAYVHCWGGVGRTGTVVGCHFVRHGRSGDEALGAVAERYAVMEKAHRKPHSPETPAQAAYVRGWARHDRPAADPSAPSRRQRYRGALLGLALGDALGTTLEFKEPGTFAPLDDLVGGGPFHLPAGAWTDDTSMALCLADSLLACGGFDARDQMARYVRWWRHGERSSTGTCFDIGNTVRAALARFEETGDPWAGSTDRYTAGNGSLMRLAPVPLYYADDPEAAVRRAADSSRTTHGARAAVDACRYYAGLLVGALRGVPKDDLLAPAYAPVEGLWARAPLCDEVAAVAEGSFRTKEPPAVRGTGYVVASLEAALWALHRSDTWRAGALLAVNLGDDADTTGAVYGQLAGALYGEAALPAAWRDRLHDADGIGALAERLMRR